MNGTGNRSFLANMETGHQANQNNEGMAGYAETQLSRSTMEDEASGGANRLSAMQDESEIEEITPYGTSSFSSPNAADGANQEDEKPKDADDVEEIDPYGTSSITTPKSVNDSNQEDGEIQNAEEIEEIDPYGTSSITTPKDNHQEEKEIKVMNDGNESKPVTGEPATDDMYATVDKKGKNKLKEQAVNDMYATVDKKEKSNLEEQATGDMYAAVSKKRESKLESQDNVDPLDYYAVVNKQKKGKEMKDNDWNNRAEEMHQLYAEVDKTKKKE